MCSAHEATNLKSNLLLCSLLRHSLAYLLKQNTLRNWLAWNLLRKYWSNKQFTYYEYSLTHWQGKNLQNHSSQHSKKQNIASIPMKRMSPDGGKHSHLGEQEGKRSLKPLFFVSPSLSSSASLGTRALPAITSLPFGIWSDACLMQVNHIPDLHSHKKHGKHEFQVVNVVTWSWWRSDPVGPNWCSANAWIIVPPFPVVADCCTQVCVLG